MRMPVTGHADELPAVGHQHEPVALLHRERRHERAVAGVDRHGDNAFAAATGDAIFERRGPLAVAVLGYCKDDLFGGAHRLEPLRLKRARAIRLRAVLVFALGGAFGFVRVALGRPALLEIGDALVGGHVN